MIRKVPSSETTARQLALQRTPVRTNARQSDSRKKHDWCLLRLSQSRIVVFHMQTTESGNVYNIIVVNRPHSRHPAYRPYGQIHHATLPKLIDQVCACFRGSGAHQTLDMAYCRGRDAPLFKTPEPASRLKCRLGVSNGSCCVQQRASQRGRYVARLSAGFGTSRINQCLA